MGDTGAGEAIPQGAQVGVPVGAQSTQAGEAIPQGAQIGAVATPAFTPDADNLSTGGEGSNTDQQLMSEESQRDATKKGLTIAATAGPAVAGLAASPLIGAGTALGSLIDASGNPIVRAAAEHLINLDKIVKIAKALSWTGFGMKEAHDLYKLVSGTAK